MSLSVLAATVRGAAVALALAAFGGGIAAQQINGTPGSPSATLNISGEQLPPPPPKFGGKIERNAAQSKPYWPPRDRAAQGRAERAADHDRRRRLRRAQHVRRRDPDADPRSHRQRRAALHELSLHRAVLADAGRADHRPQPSLGRLRRDLRAVDRLSRLQQHHRARTRPPSAASSRTTAIAPRGSARTTTCRPSRPARPGRSTSGRSAWASTTSTASSAATPASGSRTCSATPRPSIPTSASPAGT